MNKETQDTNSLDALKDIRSIMERSTRFLSLSGWSGVWAGIVALVGCVLAFVLLHSYYQDYNIGYTFDATAYIALRNNLLLLGFVILVLAVAGAYFFTLAKVKKQGERIWNSASKRFLFNLLLPIMAGAIMIFGFLYNDDWQYVAASCLVFYGLGLINASKFTVDDIRYLGIIEVALGGIALFFPHFGLYFWGLGFGLMHIIYGILMWHKYDKKDSGSIEQQA